MYKYSFGFSGLKVDYVLNIPLERVPSIKKMKNAIDRKGKFHYHETSNLSGK